jgi:hypothetical protein
VGTTAASPEDIETFAGKIDAAGVSGVCISMNGFSTTAVERAHGLRDKKAIILIDGSEIRAVVRRLINFDDLITRKRLYFDQFSEALHKIGVFEEVTRWGNL